MLWEVYIFGKAKLLAKTEGILAGISSGAALWAALQISKNLDENKNIIVVLPDTGKRYLTTELYGED